MLPADTRLRDNQDFRRAYKAGRSWATPLLVLYAAKRTAAPPIEETGKPEPTGLRIGFVVSKKQGNAVVRNRIKRRVREVVRHRLPDLLDRPLDLIFVLRTPLTTASLPDIEAHAADLLRRARLLPEAEKTSHAPSQRRKDERGEAAT